MKEEIKVPSFGESISEAVVSRILKESGSHVKQDEAILELETDKVNQEMYSPKEGVIHLTVKVGDTVQIGQVIGDVDTEGKETEAKTPSPKETTPEAKVEAKKTEAPIPMPAVEAEKTFVARKSVEESVKALKTPEEKKEYAPPPTDQEKIKEDVAVTRKKMSRLRKTIAERLVAAKNTTAMLTTFNEVDMTQIIDIRHREQESFMKRNGVKLGFMSFFVKAVVAALKEYPEVNSYIDGEEIVTFQTYHVCIAVSTERGLIVPVIRECDRKSFGDIEKDIGVFAKKAREGSLSVEDMRGGSFTITNGGVFGSMLSTPILNPPQSAILGMHTIVKRPVVNKDKIVVRPIMYLALSYDHRIVDGREAIQFLVHIKNSLEEPTRMLIDL